MPGRYCANIVVYQPGPGERMPVVDGEGSPIPDNSIRLTEVDINTTN